MTRVTFDMTIKLKVKKNIALVSNIISTIKKYFEKSIRNKLFFFSGSTSRRRRVDGGTLPCPFGEGF